MLRPVLAGLAPLPSAALVTNPFLDLDMHWLVRPSVFLCRCTMLLRSRSRAHDEDGATQRAMPPLQTAWMTAREAPCVGTDTILLRIATLD